MWWAHFTFVVYSVHVILMKTLRDTPYICLWCRPMNPNIPFHSLDYSGSVRWQHSSAAPQLCLGNLWAAVVIARAALLQIRIGLFILMPNFK